MDNWHEGDAYERYMGRWSRQVAREFVPWVDVRRGADWLDLGCGTGALLSLIAELAGPRSLAGVDRSAGFVEVARRRLGGGVDLRVGDALALPFEDESFDAAVSALTLNFIPDPVAGLMEMGRVTNSGGTVAAYVWDYADGMELIRTFWDVAAALDARAATLDEAVRFPICQPEPLRAAFAAAGLSDVVVDGIEAPAVFANFEDLWSPFLMGQGPAPTYVSGLEPGAQAALRDEFETRLPVSPDGSITLRARAWAVKGTA